MKRIQKRSKFDIISEVFSYFTVDSCFSWFYTLHVELGYFFFQSGVVSISETLVLTGNLARCKSPIPLIFWSKLVYSA